MAGSLPNPANPDVVSMSHCLWSPFPSLADAKHRRRLFLKESRPFFSLFFLFLCPSAPQPLRHLHSGLPSPPLAHAAANLVPGFASVCHFCCPTPKATPPYLDSGALLLGYVNRSQKSRASLCFPSLAQFSQLARTPAGGTPFGVSLPPLKTASENSHLFFHFFRPNFSTFSNQRAVDRSSGIRRDLSLDSPARPPAADLSL